MKKLIGITLFIVLQVSPAHAKFDPAFTWKSLETPHFLIHYHQGEEEIAKRVAVIAEDVRERLVPRIKWDPKGRTHIVLVDAMDASNGMTTPLPYNHIILFITQPVGEPGFGTMAYDDWMRLLFTHEYTHVLHLDMVTGVPDIVQDILGRLYFPNALEPEWMIEGLATYEETEQTSGGRGRSPGSEMVIRMAVLEDRFPELGQATVFPDFWPAGDVPYLFGEGFTRYIAKKYGRDKLAEISIAYSGEAAPFFVGSTGKRVLKQEYIVLWNEWLNELRTRYHRTRDELTAKGLTSSSELTKRGYLNSYPAYSPDGTRIAYAVDNDDEFPGIFLMNTDGTDDHRLVENTISSTSSGRSIAWSPDGTRLYYTKFEVQRNTNLYNDIYYYDLKRNREFRLTDGLRARDPFPSPDGRRLVFVSNRLGKTRLGVLSVPAESGVMVREKDITWLTEESGNQYETPRFDPGGNRIAVGVWQAGGYKDIWIIDGSGSRIAEVTHDRAIDGGAAWSPDGRVLYFASDRTGIFNLYAYELATKQIYQITNVLGGAFTPAPSPDGKSVVYTSYSSAGFDLHVRQLDPASWKSAEPYKDPYPVVTYTENPVETKTIAYNPLPTLVPRFWLPWFGYSYESGVLPGFITFGQDAVQHHAYTFAGYYSFKNYRKWYSFDYVYDGLYPSIALSASDVDGTYTDLLSDPTGAKDYVEREKTLGVSFIVPFLKMQKQHRFIIGYWREEISALTKLPPWPGYSGSLPAQGRLVSGRFQYLFNNAKEYTNAISPEEGRTIMLGYERFDKAWGSDFDVSKYTADWHEYINFPWKHHVLQARAFAGTSSGDVIPQRPFQLGGDEFLVNALDSPLSVENQNVYLRGYPTNAFRGMKAALASLEYRFPITSIEGGTTNEPIFLRRLHGAVFAEAGNAWDDAFRLSDMKRSIGVEGRLDTYLVYTWPFTFRLVITKGLDQKGQLYVYLGLWMPLLF